ncbi:hypothetical protein BOX37_24265 [Nocardia mangyaensis]|uniref:Integral membrane protein n=2 Tax=Nocardia mangyaensis TaxID=2213200 RepID=A0A1J0W311_9NOCA|nr:hypothetical protein BOX37_24265 [Nocardia mangyaensis]
MPTGIPTTVRVAGGLVALEGMAGVVTAIVLIVRAMNGHDQSMASGVGTAIWFAVLFGGVLAAGIALFTGRRWGRAVAVIAQVLLLPVVWSLLTDSHQPLFGSLLGIVVVGAIVALFAPASSRWMAQDYGELPEEPR